LRTVYIIFKFYKFSFECKLKSYRRYYLDIYHFNIILHYVKRKQKFKKIPKFDVPKSVRHHTLQINQPTRCNSFTSLLLDIYVQLNMFQLPPHPSSGAYNYTRSLWFYHWRVAVGALLVVVWRVDYDQQLSNRHAPTAKPDAPSAVVRS
jgi:hypothetical protein